MFNKKTKKNKLEKSADNRVKNLETQMEYLYVGHT